MYKYFIIFLVFASCHVSTKPDLESERQSILELHKKQRDYHFNKNAKAITDLSSEDFIVIDGGTIDKPKREDQFQMFDQYFKSVEFVKWDDVKEPIIRFSDDASVAYVAVEKQVVLKGLNANAKEVTDTTYFAWMSIYKKGSKGWELDAIASTQRVRN